MRRAGKPALFIWKNSVLIPLNNGIKLENYPEN